MKTHYFVEITLDSSSYEGTLKDVQQKALVDMVLTYNNGGLDDIEWLPVIMPERERSASGLFTDATDLERFIDVAFLDTNKYTSAWSAMNKKLLNDARLGAQEYPTFCFVEGSKDEQPKKEYYETDFGMWLEDASEPDFDTGEDYTFVRTHRIAYRIVWQYDEFNN